MSLPNNPSSSAEEYLAVMCGVSGSVKPANPHSTMEQYLDYLCDHPTAGAVLYDEAQSLTEEQKAQARENIGAGDEAEEVDLTFTYADGSQGTITFLRH